MRLTFMRKKLIVNYGMQNYSKHFFQFLYNYTNLGNYVKQYSNFKAVIYLKTRACNAIN